MRRRSQRAAFWTAFGAWLWAMQCMAPHALAEGPTIRILDARNHPFDTGRDALAISRSVTNDGTLPKRVDHAGKSPDATDIRVEVDDPSVPDDVAWAWLESLHPATEQALSTLRIPLRRGEPGGTFRSQFVRLVGDEVDLHAPGAESQTLLVTLRGVVRARYESNRGDARSDLRVGAPGRSTQPLAARQARVVLHVLRMQDGGPPVIGSDVDDALRIVRAQVHAANAIWLQCGVTFGEPSEVAVEVVAPPVPSLLVIGDGDALPARGDGSIRLQVDGRPVPAVPTTQGATPLATAIAVEAVLKRAGFSVELSENPKARFGAGRSTDLLVRRRDGSLARLSTDGPSAQLCTDTRQTAQIGAVDLSDGLREFDNMVAQAGTLEERALVKALRDDDPGTIDVFVVNRFTEATRQGEAFIAGARAAIVNTVILDRQGLRHLPLAWTLAHEIGHVLMNDPLHPDNIGPDRPWLLMDADNSRGTVNGPKRLRAEDCERVRSVAQTATAPLLQPFTTYDEPAPPPAPAAPVPRSAPSK